MARYDRTIGYLLNRAYPVGLLEVIRLQGEGDRINLSDNMDGDLAEQHRQQCSSLNRNE